MPAEAGAERRRVVIVGGGFGGLAAAHGLRRADADVTVVDRMNHHLFQPLLYQVATGAISEGDCASPIRTHLKRQSNASVLMAEVTDFDLERRQVILDRGERLDYDSLIVACGAETSHFAHEEWAEVSFGLKTLADAVGLRNHVFAAFEEAERADDPEARDHWLTFVVVGGGPTGVEVAGQLAVVARHKMKRDFSRIDPTKARVILVDAGERVVPAFKPSLSARVAKQLGSLGVIVREGTMAEVIDRGGVTLRVGDASERISARTVIWAAGVRAAGVAKALAAATGATTDRAGRIKIKSDLTLEGHPEVSVIGDVAALAGPDGKPLPGLATVATQQAHHAAKAIRHGEPGASGPFRYRDKGALAIVGRGTAACEIRGRELFGLPAFLMYLGVHLYYLGGVLGRRLRVLNAWLSTGFGTLGGRVIEGELAHPAPASQDAEEISS